MKAKTPTMLEDPKREWKDFLITDPKSAFLDHLGPPSLLRCLSVNKVDAKSARG